MDKRLSGGWMALAVGAFLLGVGKVEGGLTYTDGPHAIVADLSPSSASVDWSGTVQKFDPTLGELTGVMVILNATGSSESTILNKETTIGKTIKVKSADCEISVTLGSGSSFPVYLTGSASSTPGVLPKTIAYGGSYSVSVDLTQLLGESYTDPAVLSLFTKTGAGDGTLHLDGLVTVDTLLGVTGKWKSETDYNFSFGGQVFYSYTKDSITPVPEPSTYLAGIGAMGLLGVFGMRRRK